MRLFQFRPLRRWAAAGLLAGTTLAAVTAPSPAAAVEVQISLQNLSGSNGLFLTELWVGMHNGSFNLFDIGGTASAGVERVAEDGTVATIGAAFAASPAGMAGGIGGVVNAPGGFPGAPFFDPGETGSRVFNLDPVANRFLSFITMVIPSNDAFIGSANEVALFDASGNFIGADILILGSQVLDAGTEANTEMAAAFFNQTAPDQGTATPGGTIGAHPGFIGSAGNPGGTPIILGGTSVAPPGIFFDAQAADFTRPDFVVARLTVTSVPEPATLGLFGVALVGLAVMRRRSSHVSA